MMEPNRQILAVNRLVEERMPGAALSWGFHRDDIVIHVSFRDSGDVTYFHLFHCSKDLIAYPDEVARLIAEGVNRTVELFNESEAEHD